MLDGVVGTLTTLDAGLADAASCSRWRARKTTTRRSSRSRDDIAGLEKRVADLEFRRMFSHPMDPNNCFVDIQAGSGGTEAQDWAAMLLRMYLRYCERKGFQVEVLEESDGEVAGIKSASIKVERRLRLRPPAHRNRRAPPGAQVPVRFATAATPRSPACSSTPKWTTPSRSRSTPPTCASTPTAPPARAASTSTRPTRRCASPTCRPTSSCSARTTARSTATAPKRWRC